MVLLSTGMKWPVALLLNFLHALTALGGFFVGVAVGSASTTAVTWILGSTVSVFIYIALVDLVRDEGLGKRDWVGGRVGARGALVCVSHLNYNCHFFKYGFCVQCIINISIPVKRAV